LDLVQTIRAVLFPALVGTPTEITGTGEDPIGMEAGFLVKRNEVRSV
jgi:hypothetical protein